MGKKNDNKKIVHGVGKNLVLKFALPIAITFWFFWKDE